MTGFPDFVVREYSQIYLKSISQIFETEENEIVFVHDNSLVLHNGVEQTMWFCFIELSLDERYKYFEDIMNKFLYETLKEQAINLSITYKYCVNSSNKIILISEYPKFVSEDNAVEVTQPEYEEEDIMDEEKIYTGNIFEDMD